MSETTGVKHINKNELCFCDEIEDGARLKYDLKLDKYVPRNPSDEQETWEEYWFPQGSPPFTVTLSSYYSHYTQYWKHPSETDYADTTELCFYCAKRLIKNSQ